MSLRHFSKAIPAAVRESASCIVAEKIANKGACAHNMFDYRLLFVKRSAKMKSWPGMSTFPGGVIDREDSDKLSQFSPIDYISKASGSKPTDVEQVYRNTALRELQEETNFPDNVTSESLVPWSIWQTPLSIPRRFNTVFYLTFAPSTVIDLSPQEGEIESINWYSPAEILLDDSITIAPPQIADISKFYVHKTYNELQSFALARYQHHSTHQCMPVLVNFNDGLCGINPADSFYKQALELQQQNISNVVKSEDSEQSNAQKQEILCRTLLGNSRGSVVSHRAYWDGHDLSSAPSIKMVK